MKSPLYPVLIISYEMFLRAEEVLRAVKFDLVVCDEGHRLKNAEAKTTSVSLVNCESMCGHLKIQTPSTYFVSSQFLFLGCTESACYKNVTPNQITAA